MNLFGKNVIYIGGFGGIGYASCRKLLQLGIKALVIMEMLEDAEKLNELQTAHSTRGIYYTHIDVADRASVERAFDVAKTHLHSCIDVVINGSGVYDDQKVALTVQVNLLGVINCTLEAFKHMNKATNGSGGTILNISSVTGLEPNPLMAIYSATKAGIISFTRSLAHDMYHEQSGIRLIAYCPGGTSTDLIMNPIEKSTFKFTSEIHRQRNATSIKQTPEKCADGLVEVLATANNGSVWVCDLGHLEAIALPTLWSRSV